MTKAKEQSKDEAALAETEIAPSHDANTTNKKAASSPTSSPSSSKRLVGRFRLDGPLGSGGMGDVYRAYDPVLDRAVALKVMRTEQDQGQDQAEQRMRRVVREARAAAALTHPNTVTIFEVGEADNEVFIAMELLEGEDLRAVLQRGEASMEDKLRWLLEAARALETAHARGLVHRDVKPENMFICKGSGTLKLLDFGIAKRDVGTTTADEDQQMRISDAPPSFGPSSLRTEEGRRVGTPRYMAPEQHVGQSTDARTDEYAWGLVAFELVTGTHPVESLETVTAQGAIGAASVALGPARLAELRSKVPDAIAQTISRALEIRKEDRFASMTPIVEALEANAEHANNKLSTPEPRDPGVEEARFTTASVSEHPSPPHSEGRSVDEDLNAAARKVAQPEEKKPRRLRRWMAIPIAVVALAAIALAVRAGRHRLASRPLPPACHVESLRSLALAPDDRLAVLPDDTVVIARNIRAGLSFERETADGTMVSFLKDSPMAAMIGNNYENVTLSGVRYVGSSSLAVYVEMKGTYAFFGLWREGLYNNQRILGTSTGLVATSFDLGSPIDGGGGSGLEVVVVASTGEQVWRNPERKSFGTEAYMIQQSQNDRVQVEVGLTSAPAIATSSDRVGIAYVSTDGTHFAFLDTGLSRIGDVMRVSESRIPPAVGFANDDPTVYWISDVGGKTRLQAASYKLGEKGFSEPRVAIDEAVSPHRPVSARLPDGRWVLVWVTSMGRSGTVRVAPTGPGGVLIGPTDVSTAATTIGGLRATATERGVTLSWFENESLAKIARVTCKP